MYGRDRVYTTATENKDIAKNGVQLKIGDKEINTLTGVVYINTTAL